jgi:hypothetical protein
MVNLGRLPARNRLAVVSAESAFRDRCRPGDMVTQRERRHRDGGRVARLKLLGASISWAAGLTFRPMPCILRGPARPPGGQRRGYRRWRRGTRTARSRRPATTRLRREGPVRRRHAAPRQPAPRTAPVAAPAGVLGQEPLADPVQRQRIGRAGPGPRERVCGEAEEDLTGERVIARAQRRQVPGQVRQRRVLGQAGEQDAPGGDCVLGGGRSCGWHDQTVAERRRPAPPSGESVGDSPVRFGTARAAVRGPSSMTRRNDESGHAVRGPSRHQARRS